MGDRILESNDLYQRIQHKNIFKTLTKTYNRSFRARPQGNAARFHRIVEEQFPSKTVPLNSHVFATLYSNDSQAFNFNRTEFESSFPLHSYTHQSTKMLGGGLEQHSKTLTLQMQRPKFQEDGDFMRGCHTTFGYTANASEPLLMKTTMRRNQEFKLKSCQNRQQVKYQGPIDEAQFSTLELRKRLSVGSQKEGRYRSWRSSMRSEGKGNTSGVQMKRKIGKDAFGLLKNAQATQQDLKAHLQMLSKRRK